MLMLTSLYIMFVFKFTKSIRSTTIIHSPLSSDMSPLPLSPECDFLFNCNMLKFCNYYY
uniref:Uncharacterized protein n=1 Tax=Arundo donax TaxID=35708 RepID=A0A0A8Y4N6_ARUDO